MGDGATDIGVFREPLNLAVLWDLPVVFVVENNGCADFIAQRDHQRIEQVSGRASWGRCSARLRATLVGLQSLKAIACECPVEAAEGRNIWRGRVPRIPAIIQLTACV
jgi:hypothetical protein